MIKESRVGNDKCNLTFLTFGSYKEMASMPRMASCRRRTVRHMVKNFLAEVKQILHGRFLRHPTLHRFLVLTVCLPRTDWRVSSQWDRSSLFEQRDLLLSRSLVKAGSDVNTTAVCVSHFSPPSIQSISNQSTTQNTEPEYFNYTIVLLSLNFQSNDDVHLNRPYFYSQDFKLYGKILSGCVTVICGKELVFLTPWAYRR